MPDGLLHQCAIDSLSDSVPSCVGWAVPARQAEFATGRVPARTAPVAGAPARDLVRTSRGTPAWPPGFTGSITHRSGFRAAAVAARRTRRAQYKAYSRLGSRFLDVSDVHVELTGQERLRGDVWCGTFDAHLRRTQGAAGSLVFTAGVLEVEAGVGRSA